MIDVLGWLVLIALVVIGVLCVVGFIVECCGSDAQRAAQQRREVADAKRDILRIAHDAQQTMLRTIAQHRPDRRDRQTP